jgi:hypothetical protein
MTKFKDFRLKIPSIFFLNFMLQILLIQVEIN